MVQSSLYWFWLAAAGLGVWVMPAGLRAGFLAVAGFAYLASINIPLACLLAAWSVAFYRVGQMDPATKGPVRKRWFQVLIGLALVQLVCFKLFLLGHVPASNGPGGSTTSGSGGAWIVPLGVSYFTFKFIHYALEMGRKTIKPHSWFEFANYMALPPIFTAGPIERFDHFLANRSPRWSAQIFAEGSTRIVLGLIKKFVIAALLTPGEGAIANQAQLIEYLPELSPVRVWAYLFRTFLLFYLDFSAYSDIAIGAAKLLGIGIQENFNWPILAHNMSLFWKRWHMTLGGWCQSYIYMPLIGKTRNPYLSTFVAFVATGLWHGPTLGWLLWGSYHGLGVAAYVYWTQLRKRRRWNIPANPLTWSGSLAITLAFVSSASVFPGVRQVQDLAGVLRIFAKLAFLPL